MTACKMRSIDSRVNSSKKLTDVLTGLSIVHRQVTRRPGSGRHPHKRYVVVIDQRRYRLIERSGEEYVLAISSDVIVQRLPARPRCRSLHFSSVPFNLVNNCSCRRKLLMTAPHPIQVPSELVKGHNFHGERVILCVDYATDLYRVCRVTLIRWSVCVVLERW